jgi:hypothetical protein
VYITGIRFRKHGIKTANGWRFSQGVGKMRPVVTVTGEPEDLETLAHALNFALSGKRHQDIFEVWLDAADDAGDVWTIERGGKGSVFRRNGRLLSIEEAQRSLLASLLDLDASLSQVDALVAPVELRQIITRGADVAATVWDMNARYGRTDVSSLAAAKEIAFGIAASAGQGDFSDARKLSRIAGPASRILGAYDELTNQSEKLGAFADKAPQVDQTLEAIQAEVDILNQIDQLIRRINEGGESYTRLLSMYESFERRIGEIETKWTKETLAAVPVGRDSGKLLDQLVKLRAWARFVDNLARVKGILDDQVRPVAIDGVKIWDEFLSGARSNGEEIESCLASMLLGIKQMSQEVDRYVSQTPGADQIVQAKSSNWFDRLKTGSTRVVDDRFKDSAPALQHQRDWISRLAREVEAVKVATEYALQSSQGLVDRVAHGREKIQKESLSLSSLLQKASGEFDRLKADWSKLSNSVGIDENINIEQLAVLIRDASEYHIMMDTRQDLAVRVEDRRAVQMSLESHVRKWWDIIGSQKSTDLSNVSFLIVEAKGALRYRDGRRQRIQKGLEETARALGAQATMQWVKSRREELNREWAKLLSLAELPTVDISSRPARQISDAALRCAALLDIARVEEQERFAAASLWPSRLDSAVVIYRWSDKHVAPPQRTNFLKSMKAFTGDAGVPVLLLFSDSELAQLLSKAGTGMASTIEIEDIAAVEGPRREGGVVKADLKAKRPQAPSPKPTLMEQPNSQLESQMRKKSLLNPRAEAALRVLNPKAPR